MGDTAVPTIQEMFSEDLFEVLGITDIPEEERASLLVRMVEVVQTRVFDKIFDLLSQDQRTDFMNLLDSEDLDRTEDFLQHNVPNYMNLFDAEAKKLRQELVIKLVA